MANKKQEIPAIVDSVEALEAKMQAMREAQKVFATFTQEQRSEERRVGKECRL